MKPYNYEIIFVDDGAQFNPLLLNIPGLLNIYLIEIIYLKIKLNKNKIQSKTYSNITFEHVNGDIVLNMTFYK